MKFDCNTLNILDALHTRVSVWPYIYICFTLPSVATHVYTLDCGIFQLIDPDLFAFVMKWPFTYRFLPQCGGIPNNSRTISKALPTYPRTYLGCTISCSLAYIYEQFEQKRIRDSLAKRILYRIPDLLEKNIIKTVSFHPKTVSFHPKIRVLNLTRDQCEKICFFGLIGKTEVDRIYLYWGVYASVY